MNNHDRTPPRDMDAERLLLGGILRDPDMLDRAILSISIASFADDTNARIFAAMIAVASSGGHIALDTVYRKLAAPQPNDAVYIADLWSDSATGANVEYHAGIVRDFSLRRQLIHAANEILRDAYSPAMSAAEMVASAEAKIHAILATSYGDTEAKHIGPIMREVLEDLDSMIACGGTISGMQTGYPELDQMLGGLRPGELIVIGGRPSTGKTALALNILANVANAGSPVMLASIEMRGKEQATRLLAMHAGVSMHRIGKPVELKGDEINALMAAASPDGTGGAPLFIDDSASQTAARIASIARRAVRQHGIQLLAVDYLQFMTPDDTRDNRTEQVGRCVRAMKGLARELNIPVLLLSQLNRDSEQNNGRRARLSDLRDSGSIEQDADKVLLLHREPDECPLAATVWPIDVIVAKQRNGPLGDVRLMYRRPVMRFENAAVM